MHPVLKTQFTTQSVSGWSCPELKSPGCPGAVPGVSRPITSSSTRQPPGNLVHILGF